MSFILHRRIGLTPYLSGPQGAIKPPPTNPQPPSPPANASPRNPPPQRQMRPYSIAERVGSRPISPPKAPNGFANYSAVDVLPNPGMFSPAHHPSEFYAPDSDLSKPNAPPGASRPGQLLSHHEQDEFGDAPAKNGDNGMRNGSTAHTTPASERPTTNGTAESSSPAQRLGGRSKSATATNRFTITNLGDNHEFDQEPAGHRTNSYTAYSPRDGKPKPQSNSAQATAAAQHDTLSNQSRSKWMSADEEKKRLAAQHKLFKEAQELARVNQSRALSPSLSPVSILVPRDWARPDHVIIGTLIPRAGRWFLRFDVANIY